MKKEDVIEHLKAYPKLAILSILIFSYFGSEKISLQLKERLVCQHFLSDTHFAGVVSNKLI